jgi:hypothetical protein
LDSERRLASGLVDMGGARAQEFMAMPHGLSLPGFPGNNPLYSAALAQPRYPPYPMYPQDCAPLSHPPQIRSGQAHYPPVFINAPFAYPPQPMFFHPWLDDQTVRLPIIAQ